MVTVYPIGIESSLHKASLCAGQKCCLHNPSDHKMVAWPINIRETTLAERLCPHGIGHPDPDSVPWMHEVYCEFLHEGYPHNLKDCSWWIHGCDGCCFV